MLQADGPAVIALSSLLPAELAELAGVDLTDARKLVARIQKQGALPERAPATIRRVALERVRALGALPQLELVDEQRSALDPFVKYAFRCPDGRTIETVRIPLHKSGRFSVCVSSQVGCALACRFCATGQMGLVRNLEAWEIVEQVRQVHARLPAATRVHGLVFQGMGEPLANLDRVVRAIRVLSEPAGLAIDQRNITVCTSGLPAGIRRLTEELPQVRLGLSLGDARPGRRHELMPIDATHPLDEVIEAVGAHTQRAGYAPMWAYTLIAGVNDGDDAADALARRALDFASRFGSRPRLSLIPYNEIAGADFRRASDVVLEGFRGQLLARGVGSIVRYSGGSDVGAACGQLVRLGQARAGRPLDPQEQRS